MNSKKKKYPIQWDLTELYPNLSDWENDYRLELEEIGKIRVFKGTLHTADNIFHFVEHIFDGELARRLYRLDLYESLSSALDASSANSMLMNSKMNALLTEYSSAMAFVDSEIFQMPLEERKTILEEERFSPYRYALREWVDPKKVIYSEETNAALAIAKSIFGRSNQTYAILSNVDEPAPEIELPDGTKKRLTSAVYDSIIYGNYAHNFKITASDLFYAKQKQMIHTYASVLNTKLMEYRAIAKLEGFKTVRDYRLHATNIETEIYQNIINSAHNLLPDFARFNRLHKEALGVKKQYYFDTMDTVSKYSAEMEYDNAVEKVEQSLGVLGDDYVAIFERIISSGHIDVYPSEKKREGGFMTSCADPSVYPYVLLNYSGYVNEASTIAHEMGHVMYGYYSEHNPENNLMNNQPTIFTHEIASTCNEYLFFAYMMENAESSDEKLFYLEKILTLIHGTILRQCMYSEFEDYIYKIVEEDRSLDADSVSEYWMQLNAEYYGEDVVFSDSYRFRWAAIPHFYYGFYVYQYATSGTYSAVIADKLRRGEPGFADRYRAFLKAGSSDKCSQLLKLVGIDVLSKETYRNMKEYYKQLVDQYQELLRKGEA